MLRKRLKFLLKLGAVALLMAGVPLLWAGANLAPRMVAAARLPQVSEFSGALPPPPSARPDRRLAVVVAGNGGAEMTDFLIPYETLGATGAFDLMVVAPQKRMLSLANAGSFNGGVELMPHHSLASFDAEVARAPDLIVIPYLPGFLKQQEPGLAEWIRRQADRGALVVSICAGAEVLAATGLLDGEAATTHPGFLEPLERRFPQVSWKRDLRYVESARAISSGAIASGMDATLAAIRRLLGEAEAARVARQVGYPHWAFQEKPSYPTQQYGWGALARSAFRPGVETVGVVLYQGISELALGSTFDTFALTSGYQFLSLAAERRIITSRHGLHLIPRATLASAQGLSRVMLMGENIPAEAQARAEVLSSSQRLPLVRLHQGTAGFAYDAALRAIAQEEGQGVARAVAAGLNYPIHHLRLEGRRWPLALPLGGGALALWGLGLGLMLFAPVRRAAGKGLRRLPFPRGGHARWAVGVVALALGLSVLSVSCATLKARAPAPVACVAQGKPFLSPPVAVDVDPDPRVVRVELVASEVNWELAPGCVVRGWGYNGSVPGPTIEANVGDTVVVTLVNQLPEPTTIHWHGLRVPSEMDGTERVQSPVQPGERFEYRFQVPDAGTFWYHPHAHETVQLERGLYGAFVVRERDGLIADREQLLVLDDVLLQGKEIAPPGGLMERHDGREGNVLLVSGQSLPTLSMAAGQVERWRVVNAASARYVRLSLGGLTFRLLATDGGRLGKAEEVTELLLTPGDRVELAVGPFTEDTTLRLDALEYHRGVANPTQPMAVVSVQGWAPSRAHLPPLARAIEPLAPPDAPVTRQVRLGGKMSFTQGVVFLIDGQAHGQAAPIQVGELQVWEVVNETPIDHPFHLHGFFFQVLAQDGVAPAQPSWEDTVNVPAKGRVRIAFRPDDRPGQWMYHCHILEHAAAGMMSDFVVSR